MTKEIFKLTSSFLGLDDVTNYLSSSEDQTPSEEVKNQLNQLMILMNFVMLKIAKDFVQLNFKETIYSDQEGKIYFSKLQKHAIRIKDVKNFLDLSCQFEIFPDHIKVENANTEYKVFYCYSPKSVLTLSDEIELPFGVDYFVVCFGIASEYLSSKGLYDEAEMWESKFENEIKNQKHIHGERRFFARRLK